MQPERLRELISPLKGKIGFYYENMIDGDKLSYNADHVFTAASFIKFPMFMYVSKFVKE